MPFTIYMVGPGLEPVPFNESLRFDNGRDAANYIRDTGITAIAPHTKLQPRPIAEESIDDTSWRLREAARFANNTYTRTVWHNESWFSSSALQQTHFCHLSQKRPNMVSYTESPEKGRADIQAVGMLPGRYLETFYADTLDASSRKYWTQQFLLAHSNSEFHILRDTGSIVYAYQHGPSSCMSKSIHHYSSDVHPVSVYGESDLGLAIVLSDGYTFDADPKNASYYVAARCLVWPDMCFYGRVYGDDGARTQKLIDTLEGMGYRCAYDTYSANFAGARIRAIPDSDDDQYVMPYIDGSANRVELDNRGRFFILRTSGRYCASDINGVLHFYSSRCGRCNAGMDSEDATYVYDHHEQWCESCVSYNTFYCNGYDRTYSDDMPSTEIHGQTYSEHWCEDHTFTCAECDDVEFNSNRAGDNESGESVCESCADDMHYYDGCYHDGPKDESDYHSDSPDQLALDLAIGPPARLLSYNGVHQTSHEHHLCIGSGSCPCDGRVGHCSQAFAARLDAALPESARLYLAAWNADQRFALAALVRIPGLVRSLRDESAESVLTKLDLAWPVIAALGVNTSVHEIARCIHFTLAHIRAESDWQALDGLAEHRAELTGHAAE